MKKQTILFSFLIFPLFFSFMQAGPGKIAWSADRQLTWADFKGFQPKDEKFAALTDWSIYYMMKGEEDSAKVELICFFNQRESKVKKDAKDNMDLLAHEQYHFNIAEVHTRKFRKALQEAVYTRKNISPLMSKLYDENFNACKKEQNLYDKETEHSKNKAKQQEWKTKIDAELAELKNYTWVNNSFFVKN